MKVLITGGSGLLGRYLSSAAPVDYTLATTWYSNHVPECTFRMDISNRAEVRDIFGRFNPNVVIHCAANGSVDFCEKNYTDAYNINVIGTKNILAASKDHHSKFIFLSTNAVYKGDDGPYSEESNREPINRYGSIKKQAEDIVVDYHNHIIIRPFLLYGWPHYNGRTNWMATIVHKLKRNEKIKMVDDIYAQPTSAKDLANVIWKLLEFKNEAFNIAPNQKMSLYEFGLLVCDRFRLDKNLIEPIKFHTLENIAPRPIDSTYDVAKINNLGIIIPSIEKGLQGV